MPQRLLIVTIAASSSIAFSVDYAAADPTPLVASVVVQSQKVDSEKGETVRVEVSATFADGRERTVIIGYIDKAA